jgi:hypothetical protein
MGLMRSWAQKKRERVAYELTLEQLGLTREVLRLQRRNRRAEVAAESAGRQVSVRDTIRVLLARIG